MFEGVSEAKNIRFDPPNPGSQSVTIAGFGARIWLQPCVLLAPLFSEGPL